jgi:hypothetical protein
MQPAQPRCRPPHDLVRPVRVDPAGARGPTPGQARGARWVRVGHGWYVPATARRTVEQRILESSVRLPEGGAVTGWAACRLHRASYLDGTAADGTLLPVPLAIGPRGNLRRDGRVRLLHDRLPSQEVTTVAGIPCTTPERATYDACRLASDLRPAVVVLDMAFAGEITSLARMERYLVARRTCAPVVRAAMRYACERSLSPPETELRLVWVLDAGLPDPLVNWPIHDLTGRALGVPDLFDPEAGHAVEYDGAEHRRRSRHARDVDREHAFRDAGCELTRVVAPNMHRRDRLVERLRRSRSRALLVPPEQRRWQLGPPGQTLDERIVEREARDAAWRSWSDDPVGPPPS